MSVILNENLPHPPRFWWTKRIAAACLGMLLALAGAWGIWWKVAASRLADQITAIQRRGEPILPEEFNLAPVPDDQNAAEYLKAAMAAINPAVDSPRSSDMEYEPYLPMSDQWMAMARGARAGNAKALVLARQARQYDKVDWKLQVKSPVVMVMLPSLNSSRHLANVASDVALYEHLSGDDAEAIERLLDVFHLAKAVDRQPMLVSHLVSVGIYALAMQDVFIIAPGLRLAEDPAPIPTTPPARPVSRERVQELIRILLERGNTDGITRALQSERMALIDGIDWMTGNSVLLKPMYRLDAARTLQVTGPMIAQASQPNLPAARRALPPLGPRGERWSRMMSDNLTPALARFAETDFRLRADAPLAAVVLAARLYQIDHQGQWPPNLQALVPRYLPSVPIDPMSSTGKPLGYILLNNGTRPIVYSVGPDDYDSTANGTLPSPLPKVSYDHTLVDQWRDLSRFDPPPPTTAPAR